MEALIRKRLIEDPFLQEHLATFRGTPAVFQRQAPADTDNGWDGAQYPRIDFLVDWLENAERKVQGSVTINTWALLTSAAKAPEIERRIRELLDGAFFHPEGQPPAALRWAQSDMVEAGNDNEIIVGIATTFDLLAFPPQTTFLPDPIQALTKWAAGKYPTLQVDPATWSPADDTPSLYWRLAGVAGFEPLSWGSWVTVNIAGHVLAPSPMRRLEWVRRLTEALALDRRVRLADGSQLEILAVSADSALDQLTAGQIQMTARFGVLLTETHEKLQQVYVDTGGGQQEVIAK